MKYNTQNSKSASITEKTLIVGIDVGSQVHYARAFDWRNYEYSRKPFAFSNDEEGFMTFKNWMNDIAENMIKRWCFQAWSLQDTTGLDWECFCRIWECAQLLFCKLNDASFFTLFNAKTA